jgi:hypothetical protein
MAQWNQVVYARTEVAFYEKWQQLLDSYKDQLALCDYLRQQQYPNRQERATAWTSQHRHYGTSSTSLLEEMHRVLKDYLMTSQGALLRAVQCIQEMVHNKYNKYQKDIATARLSITIN